MNPGSQNHKRGAPPGNLNALKHGFYSPRFYKGELDDLAAAMPQGLKDEISLMRVIIRRAMVLAEEGREPAEVLEALDKVGMAAQRLSNMLRTQRLLEEEDSDVGAALNRALDQVVKEMGIKP